MPPKAPAKAPSKQNPKNTLGASPSKGHSKKEFWCPKANIEFDAFCDPYNPKLITARDIYTARVEMQDFIPKSPLMKSQRCAKFGFQLYYKIETLNKPGSASVRGAFNALKSLTKEQQDAGVVTASFGNFGLALAYWGRRLRIKARIVYPENTPAFYKEKCKEYGAQVVMAGDNFLEAKHEAFVLVSELKCVYISGYDHPGVIAGLGSIGLEIIEDLPEVNVILVPVGGGALIAGISAAVKHLQPITQIYGVEPANCSCFDKAMDKDGVIDTEPGRTIASSLGIPIPGYNAFYTAKHCIDKMIQIEDDWISKAVLHFTEEQKMVVEPAGAVALSALMAVPEILPEIQNKVVVCVISGANLPILSVLGRCMDRAKALNGRLIKLTMTLAADVPNEHLHALSMIANTGCNVLQCHIEHAWITDNDLSKYRVHLMIETLNLEHAAQLRRVMEKLFPDQCDFEDEPYSNVPICVCYPKKKVYK